MAKTFFSPLWVLASLSLILFSHNVRSEMEIKNNAIKEVYNSANLYGIVEFQLFRDAYLAIGIYTDWSYVEQLI